MSNGVTNGINSASQIVSTALDYKLKRHNDKLVYGATSNDGPSPSDRINSPENKKKNVFSKAQQRLVNAVRSAQESAKKRLSNIDAIKQKMAKDFKANGNVLPGGFADDIKKNQKKINQRMRKKKNRRNKNRKRLTRKQRQRRIRRIRNQRLGKGKFRVRVPKL